MKIDEILEMWEKDATINNAELGYSSLETSKLHHKYYKILIRENLRQAKLEADHDVLKLDKQEFYTGNNTKEHLDKGWVLPDRGRILKNELGPYMSADKEIIESLMKIAYQNEKIQLLKSIIDTLGKRSFHIQNAIAWEKFKSGA